MIGVENPVEDVETGSFHRKCVERNWGEKWAKPAGKAVFLQSENTLQIEKRKEQEINLKKDRIGQKMKACDNNTCRILKTSPTPLAKKWDNRGKICYTIKNRKQGETA